MNSDIIWQLIRYALLAVGGYFVHKGAISEGMLNSIMGWALEIFTIGWGLYVKYGTKAVPMATAVRADVPTVSGATGSVTTGPGA
jgi:hypothetical protein